MISYAFLLFRSCRRSGGSYTPLQNIEHDNRKAQNGLARVLRYSNFAARKAFDLNSKGRDLEPTESERITIDALLMFSSRTPAYLMLNLTGSPRPVSFLLTRHIRKLKFRGTYHWSKI